MYLQSLQGYIISLHENSKGDKNMYLDKRKFIPIVIVIGIMIGFVSFNLELVQNSVNNIYNSISHNFSWLFIGANLAAFIFSLWIIFGSFAKVKLGGDRQTPEYSNFSWISMMFTTSCSAGLIVF